jgi:hypothetical protein
MSFAEILDTHLGCTPVPPPTPVWSSRPLTTPLFAFELPLTAQRGTVQPRVEPALPARLTPLERKTLDEAQTPDALRRAYRTLAHRYHPDRHPGCSAADRGRLAHLFAEATDHYRRLSGRV